MVENKKNQNLIEMINFLRCCMVKRTVQSIVGENLECRPEALCLQVHELIYSILKRNLVLSVSIVPIVPIVPIVSIVPIVPIVSIVPIVPIVVPIVPIVSIVPIVVTIVPIVSIVIPIVPIVPIVVSPSFVLSYNSTIDRVLKKNLFKKVYKESL